MKREKEFLQAHPIALILGLALVGRICEVGVRFLIAVYLKYPFITGAALFVFVIGFGYFLFSRLKRRYFKFKAEKEVTNGKGEDSVFAGFSQNKKIFINQSFRRMHAQVVGTTNAGKTESVIVPWILDDIEKGRGLVFIDGKADRQLLNKVYAYAHKNGRTEDFKVLSLSDNGISGTYNPLLHESVDQVTEKIINSFNIENDYYRSVQFDILRNVLEVFKEASEKPNFIKIRQAIVDTAMLQNLAAKVSNPILINWVNDFINSNKEKRKENVSGLVSNLGFFATSEVANLFNTSFPSIDISQAMKRNQILYFQLPVLKSPILGKSVAKMVLQDIQAAVSERHAAGGEDHSFFSVYLDDFTEYLTPQFVSLLNKSRSANVGVVFSHQAIGDLECLGQEVKNQILTNSNLKVFMRTNEPDSAEYFAKIVGTKQTEKVTRRQKAILWGSQKTEDGSIRDAEEFIYHPNLFKSGLGLGEAVLVLPHKRGTKSLLIKFATRPNLPEVQLPFIAKKSAEIILQSTKPTKAPSMMAMAARMEA